MDLFLRHKKKALKIRVPVTQVFRILSELWYQKLTDKQKDHLMPYLKKHSVHINWCALWKNGSLVFDEDILSDSKFNEFCRSLDGALRPKKTKVFCGHPATLIKANICHHGYPQ